MTHPRVLTTSRMRYGICRYRFAGTPARFPVGIDLLGAAQQRPDLLLAPDPRAGDGRVEAATFSP